MTVCSINGLGRGSGREISGHVINQVETKGADDGCAGKLSVSVE